MFMNIICGVGFVVGMVAIFQICIWMTAAYYTLVELVKMKWNHEEGNIFERVIKRMKRG